MTERERLQDVRDALYQAARQLSAAYGLAVDLPPGERGRGCVNIGNVLGTLNRLLADCETALDGEPGRRFAVPPAEDARPRT